MSGTLNYSVFPQNKQKKNKIKNLFKKPASKAKQSLNLTYESNDDNDNNLADFNLDINNNQENLFEKQENSYEMEEKNIQPVKTTPPDFTIKPPPSPKLTYNNMSKSPYALLSQEEIYNNLNNNHANNGKTQNTTYNQNDNLMEKLNYMIHLLEEQQEQKTEYITEEIILYLFLGVFVIFVIDSFVKVGKYTR